MSFWPFGQNISDSHISAILDDYFHTLRILEKENPTIKKYVREFFDNSNGRSNELDTNDQILGSNDAQNNIVLNQNSFKTNNGSANNSGTVSGVSSSSGSPLSSENSSTTDLYSEDDEVGNSMTITVQSLNSSFIDRILDDPQLMSELTRQNTNLIDFICYGFFLDHKNQVKKIMNLDYMVNTLLQCIDDISIEYLKEEKIQDTPANNSSTKSETIDAETAVDSNPPDEERYKEQEEEFMQEKESTYLTKANIISELLSLDIWLISESLSKNSMYLNKLWSIINHKGFDSERSPLVTMFMKIHQNLLFTKTEQYIEFIKNNPKLVDEMVAHVDIPILMDFFLKIIAVDRIDSPTGIIQLVSNQGLIMKCLQYLNNEKYSSDTQACVGDFLKALIGISANAPIDDISIGPNSLTRELAAPCSIDKLINVIINEKGYALDTAVSIVIELIRKNNSDYDQVNLLETTIEDNIPTDRDPIYLGYLLKKFSEHLPNFLQIIENDNDLPMYTNQLNESYKPLGFERFKIVELIAELLHCSNMGLMNSKRAEIITYKRNLYLQSTNDKKHELNGAFNELTLNDNNNNEPAKKIMKNDTKFNANDSINNHNNNEKEETSTNEHINTNQNIFAIDDVEEVDESFEIPYVGINQNEKLRKNPTIGDLFKINLYDNQILTKIMKLFLDHPWNNFWHNVIFDILQQLFNGRMDFSYNSFLIYSLFSSKGSIEYMPMEYQEFKVKEIKDDFKITRDFILKGYHESFTFFEKMKTNLGYMGHLVLVAEEIVKFSRLYKVELISPDIQETLIDEDWQYYSNEVLNDTRIMYSKILGGGSYVDDGNGNIIPQLTTPSNEWESRDSERSGNPSTGGELINVEALEEQLIQSTESDLHNKLREMLVSQAQEDVDTKNAKNGVIILGPPPSDKEGEKEEESNSEDIGSNSFNDNDNDLVGEEEDEII
ncbi:Sap155p NDAI_0B06190 [Naumovozyma dairenensis CBS 421]|uniref:Uncharacterized protein n=1 Tax=Naumovozyma dairenensis (strain ATCC 10597 / BCRC 20456 / CBS 421 / NBRC 0211 / NRRL Y-12639) TaxID=1071378 RepID=G0W789_NAUDC|nr:hypothetical protein NDAI_0B06190 [Naumovozyma dairenensis CBS 421]CCD23650.1 hypothetical protein NDAI_0B06190 [Naumovozyma dairenensis CBS 421]